MNDFILAITITVLASSTGVALATVLPPTHLWDDPRILAPILSAAVNGIWLLWRAWRRKHHRQEVEEARDCAKLEAELRDQIKRQAEELKRHQRIIARMQGQGNGQR